jgi:hypothetical protein
VSGFVNGETLIVGPDSLPFYLYKAFHIVLICCGLLYVSFLITLWAVPGRKAVGGDKGKKVDVKFSKILLY